MSFDILFKKTSTCRTKKAWFSIEYLDESAKFSKCLKAMYRNMETSVNYLEKEDTGKVLAGGYLRDRILERGDVAPEKWDNERRKRRITEELMRNQKSYRGANGHKLVFSLSKDIESLARQANYDVDDILSGCMKHSLRKLQQKFHKGDRLAYAWGIHHDTDNPHCHIFLSNRTESGKYVAMSCPLKGKSDYNRKTPRKDQIGFIKQQVESYETLIKEKLHKIIQENKEKSIDTSDFRQRQHKNEKVIIKTITQKVIHVKTEKLLSIKTKFNKIERDKEFIKSKFQLKIDAALDGSESIKSINKSLNKSFDDLREARRKLYKDQRISYFNMKPWDRHLKKLSTLKSMAKIEIFEKEIKGLKELKSSQIKQLELIKSLTLSRNDEIKKLNLESNTLNNEYKNVMKDYEQTRNNHNVQLYLNNVATSRERRRYILVLSSLKSNKSKKLPIDKELAYLKEIRVKAKYYRPSKLMPKSSDLFTNYTEDVKEDYNTTTNNNSSQRPSMSHERGESYGY
jgi:hypothetical protein